MRKKYAQNLKHEQKYRTARRWQIQSGSTRRGEGDGARAQLAARGEGRATAQRHGGAPAASLSSDAFSPVIRCLVIEPFPEFALNEQAGKMLLENYSSLGMRSMHGMQGYTLVSMHSSLRTSPRSYF
ncbi:uncharacterized protein LOC120655945 [Panicum virgatum]|uniref:uncharacterized protein LOC120655945 n=1 Tax=Panicum virgatum TaxID=38727 RepID=UPI0019D5C68C|nr:uncharacterized protein LOC120655945 [Panicum virgatum]